MNEDEQMDYEDSLQQDYIYGLEQEPEEMANEDLEADINYYR